jgi:hypothetical protein
LDDISSDIGQVQTDLRDLSATANFAADQAKSAMDRAVAAENRLGESHTEYLILKNKVAELNANLLNVECQSRRTNLVFSGIEENSDIESWDESERRLRDVLKCVNLEGVHFERVHRIGMKNSMAETPKPRNIIARFTYYKEREKVWLSRFALSQQKGIWISEDFPDAIKSNRRTLLPALRAAQRSPQVKHASLRVDKLVIDKKTYTVETMANLPAHLQPDKTAIVESDDAVVFFTKHAVFSNFHAMPIVIDGQKFMCNEQYFQFTKALDF